MSLHPPTNPTPRRRRRPFAILRILAAGVGIAASTGMAGAADPVAPPGAAAQPSAVGDVVLARAALAAIDADPDLKGVNLVVSVVDRVAVIGGPVATARQAKRAEEIVRGVRGIADVRNTCFVALGPDPLLRSVVERMGSSLPPRPTMYELPGVLTNHLTPTSPLPEPATPNPGAAVAAADPPRTTVVRKPSGEPGLLGAPVGPPGASPTVPPPAAPQPTPAVLTGTAGGVLLTANEMKKADARFAHLTLELREGTLVIGGSAAQASDAWDLAKKLQAVPGMSRIVVSAVARK